MNSIVEQIKSAGYDYIVLYPGRFQPFTNIHKMAFNWLCKEFEQENVLISLLIKFEYPKQPFTAIERKTIIQAICPEINPGNIGFTNNLGYPVELFKGSKKVHNKTVPIIAVGEKDCHRYNSNKFIYLKPDTMAGTDGLPTIAMDKYYFVLLPDFEYTLPAGDKMKNLSEPIRELFIKGFDSTEDGKGYFKTFYGDYNDDVYNLLYNRLCPKIRTTPSKMKEILDVRDLNDPKYKSWRFGVMSKYSFRCVWCGLGSKDGVKIEAHHIVRWADDPRKRYMINNGCTLCEEHHTMVTGKEEKYEPLLRAKCKEHLQIYGEKITNYEINRRNKNSMLPYRRLNPRIG